MTSPEFLPRKRILTRRSHTRSGMLRVPLQECFFFSMLQKCPTKSVFKELLARVCLYKNVLPRMFDKSVAASLSCKSEQGPRVRALHLIQHFRPDLHMPPDHQNASKCRIGLANPTTTGVPTESINVEMPRFRFDLPGPSLHLFEPGPRCCTDLFSVFICIYSEGKAA